MTKEEKRQLRRQRRQARRTNRRQRRAQRRESGGKPLSQILADKLQAVVDYEITKIQVERQELPAEALATRQAMQTILQQAQAGIVSLNIPVVSKVADIVPDMLEGVRKQIRQAYNFSQQHGYQGKITPELLTFVVLESVSKKQAGAALGQIEQNRILIKNDDPNSLKAALQGLGGIMAGRLLKSVLTKFVPVVGPSVALIWDQLAAARLQQTATMVFGQNKDLVFTQSINPGAKPITYQESPDEEEEEIDKLYTLIHLMQTDKHIAPEERSLFAQILQSADIDAEEKEELRQQLDDFVEDDYDADLSFYQNNEEAALALISDLIAMAKADHRLDNQEKNLILNIGKKIHFSTEEIHLMLQAKNT
ncbi:MAG: TerB family tellurite resistance protein [Bernardetiaceae bacterium]